MRTLHQTWLDSNPEILWPTSMDLPSMGPGTCTRCWRPTWGSWPWRWWGTWGRCSRSLSRPRIIIDIHDTCHLSVIVTVSCLWHKYKMYYVLFFKFYHLGNKFLIKNSAVVVISILSNSILSIGSQWQWGSSVGPGPMRIPELQYFNICPDTGHSQAGTRTEPGSHGAGGGRANLSSRRQCADANLSVCVSVVCCCCPDQASFEKFNKTSQNFPA